MIKPDARNATGKPRGTILSAMTLAAMLLAAPAAWANPFFAEEEATVPRVRTPTSQGPLVERQRSLRERSAEAIRSFSETPSSGALAALLGAALLYGVLHAAGPGHRKTVVFSLFLSREAAPWEPLAAGFLAAGVHAGVGVAIVGVLSAAYDAVASLGDADRVAASIDIATFGLLIAISAALAVGKAISLARYRGRIHQRSVGGKGGLYGIVVVSSLVPCPGATMLLLFAIYAGLPWLGVAAVLAMSLGMGLVISAAGYLAYAGRERLFARLKTSERAMAIVSEGLELLSYLAVLAFSLYMAWPAISGALY